MRYKSRTNIVVVCWNALEYTKITLSSLFSTVHHHYLLTIVDNGSSDETGRYLKDLRVPDLCEKYVLITNSVNRGYGGAINQGYQVSQEYGLDYTCICNNDLFFQDNWLFLLEEYMDSDTSFGILGTLRPTADFNLLYRTQLEQDLIVSQDRYIFQHICQKMMEINNRSIEYLRCPPDAIVTYCALVRNSAVSKIGFLADPQFGIYGSEDLDLSWELERKGYKCVVLNRVYVHHFRHRSVTTSGLDRDKYLLQNNLRFYQKWKRAIFVFLDSERKSGVNIQKNFSSEENREYWFLRRIQEKIDFIPEYNRKK